ncbi:hypothetical protein BJV74DRAFT_822421 [Russula compacta]|nr:hypothetical protein BJV74DRAFT_822421 [Russula compacta]
MHDPSVCPTGLQASSFKAEGLRRLLNDLSFFSSIIVVYFIFGFNVAVYNHICSDSTITITTTAAIILSYSGLGPIQWHLRFHRYHLYNRALSRRIEAQQNKVFSPWDNQKLPPRSNTPIPPFPLGYSVQNRLMSEMNGTPLCQWLPIHCTSSGLAYQRNAYTYSIAAS